MFYDTKLNNHGLKYNPFKSCVVPRPIAWISTISKDGVVNLGPYSYFNAVSDIPPIIVFGSGNKPTGGEKDSLHNIKETSEFVINICSFDQRDEMSMSSTSLPYDESEAEKFGIEMTSSQFVKAPRIKASKISLECKYLKTESFIIDGIQASSQAVFGHVVGIFIDDEIIEDGKVQISKLQPIARLGYDEYAVINEVFKMQRL